MIFLNTTTLIKKVLTDGTNPVTGLVATDFSGSKIFLYKANGTKVSITLTLGVNFFELDSTDAPGLYHFSIPNTNLDQEGPLAISFKPSATAFKVDSFVDTVILPSTSIYNRIGAPVGASISADIANSITSIKGTASLTISDLGGSLFNPSLDNLHALKAAINAVPTGISDAVWDETTASHISAGTYGEFISIISAIFLNRVKIDYATKSLVIYQADNVTPLKTYSLFDQFLNPATLNATERSKAT